MPDHSAACQRLIDEFLSMPGDSVAHRIAAFVDEHTPEEGLDLLLTVIDEDALEDSVSARRLWPVLSAEVTR